MCIIYVYRFLRSSFEIIMAFILLKCVQLQLNVIAKVPI